ncbi:MAG TPA: protein kinase [Thermoanaerobaculia bacterium]|nr:protein kinase [Thermoanaerobaculia bacterium]
MPAASRASQQAGGSRAIGWTMAPKSKFMSLLTRDYAQRAEALAKEGKKEKAAELYARGGDFHQAARLAIEMGDEALAVDYSLRATLGHIPEGYAGASAQQTAELLAVSGHHKEAVALFDLAKAYRKAAESSLKLHQYPRAARYYERAKAWAESALYYQRAGMLEEALRLLEMESNRLRQEGKSRPSHAQSDSAAEGRLREVDLRRVELMRKLGKGDQGVALLRDARPTQQTIKMLEEAGKYDEAISSCLEIGEVEEAARLLRKAPDVDRRLAAQVYLRCGQAKEAGHILAALGRPREAAEAYEAGQDWALAGSRWEAAQDQERAAHAYLRAGRPRDAGRCFAAAGKPQLAAASFAKAGDHGAAAAQYLKSGQPLAAANELFAMGDRVEAAKVLMQVAPGSPDYEEGTLLLAPLLVEEGLHAEAQQRLRRLPAVPAAQTLRAGSSAAAERARQRLYWEGRVDEGLDRPSDAERCYRKLLELAPDHPDSQDAAERLERLLARRQPIVAVPPPAATAAQGATLVDAPRGSLPGGEPVAGGGGAAGAGFNLAVGQLLAGRYDIVAELGRGGMGRVYKAYDREVGELVAIKTLLGQADDGGTEAERLLREVQICRKITHPNVVRVFDLGRFAGGIFVTMELLEGERLDSLIDRASPLPLTRVRSILIEIATGLAEAHSLGIVHRDLKPGNIIITSTRLKILDFGIARMAGFDTRLTQTGFAVGSPMYMSPEQLQGIPLDGRSDLYSLGVVAYALIAGREPFDGATGAAIAVQHLQQPPPDIRRRRPDLLPGWPELLGRLLAKKPAERYRSAGDLLAALDALPIA